MDTSKRIGWFVTKNVLLVVLIAAIAWIIVAVHFEIETKSRFRQCIYEHDVQSFALVETRLDATPVPIPASLINWDSRDQWTDNEKRIPTGAIDWFSNDLSMATGDLVRIIDLEGPEEILVVRRGLQFSAYKVPKDVDYVASGR